MSERYSKLFSLPENLYAEGSPVVISAGALLKDNNTGKVLAQLKLRNIDSKRIKAVKIILTAFDVFGNENGETKEHLYLDLSEIRNSMFGQKVPIHFSDNATRSFAANVTEVVFSDNSVWQASGNEKWEPLEKGILLSKNIKDPELLKQYRINSGSSGRYTPREEKDLWICACEEINHQGETHCAKCKVEKQKLFTAYDLEKLESTCKERLAIEKAEAEKAAALAKKKTKKTAIISAIVLAVIVIFVVSANAISKASNYKYSLSLLEEGKYDEAITGFEALGDYKNCPEMILESNYRKADEYLAGKYFDKAIDAFTELGDYKDSAEKVKESHYREALKYMDEKEYRDARDTLGYIKDYKDSADLLLCCNAILTSNYSLYSASKLEIPELSYTKGLRNAIKKYLPYCGDFKCIDRKDRKYYIHSDFKYSDKGVSWKVTKSEKGGDGTELMKFKYEIDYYHSDSDTFFDSWQPVSGMEAEEYHYKLGTATVTFHNSTISFKYKSYKYNFKK